MILTVTPTPVLERSGSVDSPITGGDLLSLQRVDTYPGGSGVTIAHTAYLAGSPVHAIFPAPEISHYLRMISLLGLPHDFVPVAGPIQTRFTVRDSSGQSTQFLDPAMPLDAIQLAGLRDLTVSRAEKADWVVLAGPLPDVAPNGWYVDVIRALSLYHPGVRTSVATSGNPLRAIIRQLSAITPTLLSLNPEDISNLLPGPTSTDITSLLQSGEISHVIDAVKPLLDSGVSEVLISFPPDRAVSVSSTSGWLASVPTAVARQCSHFREKLVAGYLMAETTGAEPDQCLSVGLAYAVAVGTDPDCGLPTPDIVRTRDVTCTPLDI
ncbi:MULTISPECIES: 1-phosphofructokinase family hexose kinase [unclassified Corynebacterium]|uniref:1-phosphofructokinase family hexose kinase n=1 Tax=unclassified Corynebacterium TaxID=2624378 RepID=UPI00352376C9